MDVNGFVLCIVSSKELCLALALVCDLSLQHHFASRKAVLLLELQLPFSLVPGSSTWEAILRACRLCFSSLSPVTGRVFSVPKVNKPSSEVLLFIDSVCKETLQSFTELFQRKSGLNSMFCSL